MSTLNEVFSTPSARRRYEVWFLRMGLASGAGAWWFRYLLMNPGRNGCAENPRAMPVQVWATWFPAEAKPQSFIQGFNLSELNLSTRGGSPFRFQVGLNEIDENRCSGALNVDGHVISWDLQYRSTFHVTLSEKGWIGFSRTPHSDAIFSGSVTFDGRRFENEPLGFGIQGHNCGYRHRKFWAWGHAYFSRADQSASTLEALVYEMPFGFVFRKAVLWHAQRIQVFRRWEEIRQDRENLQWDFRCIAANGDRIQVAFEGNGSNIHRLEYQKTDCSGTFEVFNNSLARATVLVRRRGSIDENLETSNGSVLEMAG